MAPDAYWNLTRGEVLPGTVRFDRRVAMFCGVTGDYHQYAAFAEQSFYGQLTIPGLLIGNILTHIGSLLCFLATEISFDYVAPIFVGDTIFCTVTIAEKDEEKRRAKATAGFVTRTTSRCHGRCLLASQVGCAWLAKEPGMSDPKKCLVGSTGRCNTG